MVKLYGEVSTADYSYSEWARIPRFDGLKADPLEAINMTRYLHHRPVERSRGWDCRIWPPGFELEDPGA